MHGVQCEHNMCDDNGTLPSTVGWFGRFVNGSVGSDDGAAGPVASSEVGDCCVALPSA
jgi:hypothetical protein